MKKYFLSVILFIAALSVWGCSSKKTETVSENNAAEATQSTSGELATSIESPTIAERIVKSAEGTFVYDNAGLLSDSDLTECNDYAGWLYENYLINAAVVTTDSLGGKTPSEYAAEAYNDIYEGKGSGLLLLINNDTNQDLLYKTGSCLLSVSAADEEEAFYWATRDIVGGDLKTAVLRLMQLGEKCPMNVFDNAGVFTAEQVKAIEAGLTGSGTEMSVLATSNSTAVSNEDILHSYFQRKYGENSGIMIMVDTHSKSVLAVSDTDLPDNLDAALKKANESSSNGDYQAAVNTIIEAINGTTENPT